MTLAELRKEVAAFRAFRNRAPYSMTLHTTTWNALLPEAHNSGALKTVGEEFDKRHRFVVIEGKGEVCEKCGEPHKNCLTYFCPRADTRPICLGMRVTLDDAFPRGKVVLD